MLDFFRKIEFPTPIYGWYGGQKRKCIGKVCPKPVDGLDMLFARHDEDLYIASTLVGPVMKRRARRVADKKLAIGLRAFKGPYANVVWGPIYKHLASLVFRP